MLAASLPFPYTSVGIKEKVLIVVAKALIISMDRERNVAFKIGYWNSVKLVISSTRRVMQIQMVFFARIQNFFQSEDFSAVAPIPLLSEIN